MTHLKIQNQNNNIEIVNSNIIQKLYETVSSNDIQSIDLSGNLQSEHCKESAYNYLTGNIDQNTKRFPNLQLNITNSKYIDFQDPLVEEITKNVIGGNVQGVSKTDLATITSLSAYNTADIIYFNELQYFTGLSIWNLSYGAPLSNCTGLKEITFPYCNGLNYNRYFGTIFSNSVTKSLEVVKWARNPVTGERTVIKPSSVGYNLCKCPNLTWNDDINPVILGSLPDFNGCTSLDKMIFHEGGTKVPDACFNNCTSIRYVEIPTTVTSIGTNMTFKDVTDCSIVIKNPTPPTLAGASYQWAYVFGNNNCCSGNPATLNSNANTIYVPDGSVNNYITSFKNDMTTNGANNSNFELFCENQIKPLSTLPAAIRALGTVTQEDIDRVANST